MTAHEGFGDAERLRAELDELRRSHDELGMVVQAITEGLMVAAPDGTITRVNQATAEVGGVPADALLGRRLEEAAVPAWDVDGRPLPFEEWPGEVTRRTGRAVSRRRMLVRLAHGERWLEVSSAPSGARDGPFHGVVVTFADVTARVRAEGALRTSEERFRSLVDSMGEALLVLDREGRVELANAAAARWAGRPAAELVGVPLHEMPWQPAGRSGPSAAEPVLDVVLGGEPVAGIAMEMTDGSGEHRWFEVNVAPFGPGPPFRVAVTAIDVTGHVRAEQVARESERRYRTLAEHASDAISRWDLEGNVLYLSPSSVRQSGGWSLDELRARMRTGELVHPDDRHLVELVRTALSRGEDPPPVRMRTMRPDGTWMWSEGHYALVRDGEDRPTEVVIVGRDVTAQVEAEQALAASEARYRLLAEHASDMISWWDLDEGRPLYISPAAERLTGRSGDDLVHAITTLETIHPDDMAAADALLAALSRGEDPGPVRLRSRHADGRWIWTEGHYALVPGTGDPPRQFVSVTRDITRQVEAEQALAASEARYRLVAENAADVIFRLAPDGEILWVSPSSRRVTGFSPEELTGRHAVEIVHPEDHGRVLLRTGQPFEAGAVARLRLTRRDGGWFWAEITYNPLRDADGQLVEVHTAVHDVSERVAHEEAERERIREREELVAVTSHELKAPLGALAGLLWLVSEDAGELGEAAQRRLAAARARLAQLRRLAGDLTTMTQLDARSLSLRPKELDLADLARDLVAEAQLEADRAGLTVEVHTRQTPVLADPGRVAQVVDNLLSNAIKFSPPGGRVQVGVEGDFAAARVWVSDEGPGIPPRDRERLFGRFTRGPDTDSVPGSGLGLSIARAVARAHGGEVRLEDPPEGRGLRAVLELPRDF